MADPRLGGDTCHAALSGTRDGVSGRCNVDLAGATAVEVRWTESAATVTTVPARGRWMPTIASLDLQSRASGEVLLGGDTLVLAYDGLRPRLDVEAFLAWIGTIPGTGEAFPSWPPSEATCAYTDQVEHAR